MNKVIHGDCLEIMPTLPDKSIDMILCDLPYGTTRCKWDAVIPLEPLWEQYKRLIKDNGAIVLTASQPFTSALVMSNPKMFRCEWIWNKNAGSNFGSVKYQPMKDHENILIFSILSHVYNPQMQERSESGKQAIKRPIRSNTTARVGVYGFDDKGPEAWVRGELRYPSSVQKFNRQRGHHPTQKPVALFEYLIKTYTNEGETVLDNCAGSGTTAIACLNTNRKYILIEKEQEYIDTINKRISEHEQQPSLFGGDIN